MKGKWNLRKYAHLKHFPYKWLLCILSGIVIAVLGQLTIDYLKPKFKTEKYYFDVKTFSENLKIDNLSHDSIDVFVNLKNYNNKYNHRSRSNPYDIDLRVKNFWGSEKFYILGLDCKYSDRDHSLFQEEKKWVEENLKNIKSGDKIDQVEALYFHKMLYPHPYRSRCEIFYITKIINAIEQNSLVIVDPSIIRSGISSNQELKRGVLEATKAWKRQDGFEIIYLTNTMLDTLKSRYNIEFPNITLSRLDTAKFAADVNKLAKLTRSTAVAAFCGDLDDYRLEIVYFLDQGIRTNFDTKILKFCISTTVADPSSMSCIINSVKTNASIAEPIIASYAKAAQAYDNKDLSNSQKMTKNFVRELLSQKESHHELKSFKLDPDGWQSALNFAAISKNLPYRESNSICKNSLQQAMNDYASLFKLNETTFNDQEFVDAILQSTNIADTNQIEQNVLNLENLAQIYMMRPIDGAISTIDNSAISNIIAKIDTFESKVIARNAAKDSSIISHLAYAQFWHKTSMADATYYDTAYWDSVRTGKYQLLEEFYFEIATRLDNDNRQNGFDNKLKAILDEQRLVTMLQNFLSEIPNGELKNRWEIYLNH